LNPRVLEIPGSLIRQIAAKRRPDSIDLGLGEPTLMPTTAYLDAAMADVKARGLRYSHNAGDPEMRVAIAKHYGYPGMEYAENVCVTTGSQEAMYAVLKTLLDPATDELLVVEPAFPSYVKMAMLEGVAVRTVPMSAEDDYAFDAERIVAAIGAKTRAIVICSPCNPTARVLRGDEARALVEALERRGGEPVWLIHDEIYREQTFVDDASELARLYPHTIVTNSLSKSNALTGLRIGWFVGPAAAVIRARDDDHAIELANASTFGLGGSIWTRDVAEGERLAARLECGCAFVNAIVASDPRVPFGGVKRSGYGRELSAFGLHEFVNVQTVWVG
jgi:aspartate/methionine/tyrosine aminotransferase